MPREFVTNSSQNGEKCLHYCCFYRASATEKPGEGGGGDTEHAGRVVNKTKSTKHEQNKSNIYLQSHDIKLA